MLLCPHARRSQSSHPPGPEGYIVKPHTSAGRIPTDRGYRYYLDHLSPGSLRRSTHTRIETFFSSMHSELGRMLRQTSDLLSEVSHYPAVVVGPGLHGQTIRDAHLIPVEPSEVLVVIVTGNGNVNQTVLHLAGSATPAEVTAAGEALLDRLAGAVLGGAKPLRPTARVVVGGAAAMGLTMAIGSLVGAAI